MDEPLRTDRVEEYLAHSRWVERLALQLVGDTSAAEDVVQETWIAAMRRPPKGAVRPFLGAVARKLALRRRRTDARADARHRAAGTGGELPPTDELVAEAELRTLVGELVTRLDEPYRTTLLLRFFKDLSAADIARREGIPAGTVRARVSRGLEKLRAELDARHAGERGAWVGTALRFAPPVAAPPLPVLPPILGGILAMKGIVQVVLLGAAVLVAALVYDGLSDAETTAPAEGLAAAAPVPRTGQGPRGPADVLEASRDGSAERRAVAATPARAAEHPAEALESAAEPPITARVEARLVDDSGRALAGSHLVFPDQGLRFGSDALGHVEAELELPGPLLKTRVLAEYSGLATVVNTVGLRKGQTSHLGELVLGPAGVLAGRVEDELGRPLEEARLLASGVEAAGGDPDHHRRHGPPIDPPLLSADAGPGGTFRVAGVATGHVLLWATAPGLGYAWIGPLEVRVGETIGDLVLVVPDLGSSDSFEGVVRSPDGEPIPQCSVLYSYEVGTGYSTAGTVSDADGRFSILVQHRVPHDFRIHDSKGRWADALFLDVEPGTLELELRFAESTAIHVAVRTPEGSPIERFGLEAEGLERTRVGVADDALASLRIGDHPQGEAVLHAPAADFVVRAHAVGYASAEAGPYSAERPPEELSLTLEPLPGFRGRVLDAEGNPVNRARITVRRHLGPNDLYVRRGFRLLSQSERITGVRTDEDGRFVVHLPGSGRFTILAERSKQGRGALGPLDLDPAIGAEGLELRLGAGGVVEGRVLTPAGMDPAGVIVALNGGHDDPLTQRVGPEGTYRFEGLLPGPYQVSEREREIDPTTSTTSMSTVAGLEPMEWSCEVFEGETTVFDLDLRDATGVRLSGELQLSQGSTAGWTAVARPVDEQSAVTLLEVAGALDAGGAFELELPAAGTYLLVLRSPQGEHGQLELSERLDVSAAGLVWSHRLSVASLQVTGLPADPVVRVPTHYRWTDSARREGEHDLRAEALLLPDAVGRAWLPVIPAGAGEIARFELGASASEVGGWVRLAGFAAEAHGEAVVELP